MDAANQQVVDAVAATNYKVIGDAPSQSQGITLETYSYSLSLMMINAASNQNAGAQLANASVVSTCAEILKAAAGVIP